MAFEGSLLCSQQSVTSLYVNESSLHFLNPIPLGYTLILSSHLLISYLKWSLSFRFPFKNSVSVFLFSTHAKCQKILTSTKLQIALDEWQRT
jgi:hypothetical protein